MLHPKVLRSLPRLRNVSCHVTPQRIHRKRRSSRSPRGVRRGPSRRLLHLLRRFQHRIRAIRQRLHPPSASPAPRPPITLCRAVDPFQHRLQRHPGLLPGLHNRPVQRRHQQVRPALLPKIFFNLSEVVEVIPGILPLCLAFAVFRAASIRLVRHQLYRAAFFGSRFPPCSGVAAAATSPLSIAKPFTNSGFLSQINRNPFKVKNSSVNLICFDPRATNFACPPVAMTGTSAAVCFCANSAFMRASIPSTISTAP